MKHGVVFTATCCACSAVFCTGAAFGQVLQHVRTVVITTTEEGGSARPQVAATADRVFVLYLGNIQSGAMTFGDLSNPHSEVSKLAHSRRAYKLLEDLGTEPKVIYLREGE